MKRLIVLIVGFLLCWGSCAQASPAYGTKMPTKKQAFWGLQYSYLNDHQLEKNAGTVQSHQNFLMLSYGLADWFSLDLKYSLWSTFRNDPSSGPVVKYDQPMWGGGYGFRVRLYEDGPVKVVTGFQHFSIHPKTVKENGYKHNGILEDWQISTVASYAFKKITPYAGVRYTFLDYIYTLDDDRDRINSDDDRRINGVLGVDIPLTQKVWVNVEGTAGAEQAMAASLMWHF